MMHIPQEWLWPYITSNLLALALVLIAWRWPVAAKWLFAAMFLGASYANSSLALRRPEDYLNYDQFVLLNVYHDFITGYFTQHVQAFVLAIATGQFVIGVLLCTKGLSLRLGILGASIFLAAIIPLGVGSAFPFSLFCISALLLLYMKLSPAPRTDGVPPSHQLPNTLTPL
jgi:hypothetical protein